MNRASTSRFRTGASGLAVAALVVMLPAVVSAQAYPASPDPAENARLQMGPVSIRPTLILRDVGVDSNVFNGSGNGQEDFSFTAGAKVDVGMRLYRMLATYSSTYEYMYFQKFKSERGANRGSSGRIDFLLGRMRPWVEGSIVDSHERPNAEIDVRPHRREMGYGAGAGLVLFTRTTMTGSYRRFTSTYADDEFFAGALLADALNRESESIQAGLDFELTPLTSLGVNVNRTDDHFTRSPERDAETRRYGVTLSFEPGALVSGRAQIGYRQFRPQSASIPEKDGMAAAVALAATFRDRTRAVVSFDHDIRYSFADLTPYYLSTAARATLTERLAGPIDLQVIGGIEHLHYEPRADAANAARSDRLHTIGGGVGYRLGENSRLGLNIDHTKRSSPVEQRRYTRRRIFGSLTYEF
jgi:hypothetical protein